MWVHMSHISADFSWKCIVKLKKIAIFCNFTSATMSHILPWKWVKSAYFLGNSHFFLIFRKKNCNFLHIYFWVKSTDRCVYLPWNRVKTSNFLGFEHFLPKNCKKSAIFVQKYFSCKGPHMSRICPMNLGKIAQNCLFWAIFVKKVQFFAIFCTFIFACKGPIKWHFSRSWGVPSKMEL